jgi:hypothetical protein
VIHTGSANPDFPWERIRDWPEESGGPAVLEQIIARSQAIPDLTTRLEELKKRLEKKRRDVDHQALRQQDFDIRFRTLFADPVLLELLAPERSRQYGEMTKAINRVCELVDGQRQSSLPLE